MRKNAFADALAADLDDELGSEATLTMNGETPSLDASDAHSVGDSDDLSDEAETEASQAVTQANNIAASATKGKRKLSPRQASGAQQRRATKHRRVLNHAALMKMNTLDQANGADIKCLFIPGKKAKDGQHAIPLLPQFDAQWRDADFGTRTWLVISTQSRWVQLLMKTQLRNNPTAADSRTACAHLCASVKLEFDACLHTQRCRLRAKEILDKEKNERKSAGVLASSDESSAENEDDSQETEKAQEIDRHQFRVDSQTTPYLQIDIGGSPVTCINTKKRVAVAVDTQVAGFISKWLMPLAEKSGRDVYLDHSASRTTQIRALRLDHSTSRTSDASSGFTFTPVKTPNIKDKVYWIPSKRSWKVKAQKRVKDRPFTDMFVVDDGVTGEAFLTMKAEKYLLAVTEWDLGDKSTRSRIAI